MKSAFSKWNAPFKIFGGFGALVMFACVAAGDAGELVEQAERAYQRGAIEQAAADWEAGLALFRAQNDTHNSLKTSVSLASAYQTLGQHRRAVQLLESAQQMAEGADGETLGPLVTARLGAALAMTREYERAEPLLNQSLNEAKKRGDDKLAAGILNDQGNLFAAQQRTNEALAAYGESAAIARQAGDSWMTAQALANAATTAAFAGDKSTGERFNTQALEAIDTLPDATAKAFLLLTAAETDRKIGMGLQGGNNRLKLRAHESLTKALKQSEKMGDERIQTYALGYLGRLYEQDGQMDPAYELTRRAMFTAQKAQMPEALYRWEWQAGRLLRSKGDSEGALAYYRRAIGTLRPIRNDVSLGSGNSVARSFRESEGPLFLELADLLLQKADATKGTPEEQAFLVEARDTVEQMKTVELEDYLCDECVDVLRAKTKRIEAVDENTAVVYFISLSNRTDTLVGLTSGLQRFSLAIGAEKLTAEVRQFRRNLETRTTFEYLDQAQELHKWLIEPIEQLLKSNGIDTLVFVPDGALRTIPFAALQDGERFLIEDFAVAVVPGLTLVEPRPITHEKARLLLGGLSQEVQGFPALQFVTSEIATIAPLYNSQTLLDGTFTLNQLQRKLEEEQYSIVHLASHGQFNRDVRKTFLLTHDSKLTLNGLEAVIRPAQYRGRPVELLVLSACQTAAGDDRAALGLAGVAVKAGARSALATLWFVNDQSTSTLVTEVYRQLLEHPEISKAHALQAAQIQLLKDRRYRHPCYWSPYLMIGNWL